MFREPQIVTREWWVGFNKSQWFGMAFLKNKTFLQNSLNN